MQGSNIITNSRRTCLHVCPYKHFVTYELGIRSDDEAKALRFGRIYHIALDMLAKKFSLEEVCATIRLNYDNKPDHLDEFWWAVERETILRLVCGYQWFWQADTSEIIESERVFSLPIINPETGGRTPNFIQGGKKDKKIRAADGRIGLREHKTSKDSIAPESDYWAILRIDSQISMYFDADAELQFIEYDVTHKPGLEPKQIPLTDSEGFKIVLDGQGQRVYLADKAGNPTTKPRQAGDSEKGWTLQTRIETVEEFSQRLADDIAERPAFYYARVEIPRLLADQELFRKELWQDQLMLRHRQKNDLWPRHPSKFACPSCDIKGPCFARHDFAAGIPVGFTQIDNIHPELGDSDVIDSAANGQAEQSTSSTDSAAGGV